MRTIAFACCAACVLGSALAAQSLGPVAARESARRAAISTPARVLTNADLEPSTAGPEAASDERSAAPAGDDTAGTRPRALLKPATLQGGAMPAVPVSAVNGGEVALEIEVASDGSVGQVTALRSTPPFTEALAESVATWRFAPAEDAVLSAPGGAVDARTRRPVSSHALVLGIFRPPSVFQGMAPGTPPSDLAEPSDAVPTPTGSLAMPPYPVQALFGDVVLIEIAVNQDGTRGATRVVRGAPPFDAPALEAVAGLGFRPARVHGRPAPAMVYVAVGFRQPLTP